MAHLIQPQSVLAKAIKAVPALKYALGVAGIAAVIAIILGGWKIDPIIAVLGISMMLIFMVVLRIFSTIPAKKAAIASGVLLWFALVLFMAVTTALFTSVLWDKPVPLKAKVFYLVDRTSASEMQTSSQLEPASSPFPRLRGLPDTLFETAGKITTRYALAAFVAGAVIVLIWIIGRKSKDKTIPVLAWIVLIVVIFLPITAEVVIAFVPTGTYRVTVIVLDPDKHVIADAHVTSSLGGQEKRTGNGFEFEIPSTSITAERTGTFYADKADLQGQAMAQFSSTRSVSVTIFMESKRSLPKSTIRHTEPPIPEVSVFPTTQFKVKVVDKDGQPVAWAKVSCNLGRKETTDPNGEYTFVIPEGSNSVEIQVWANGYHHFERFDKAQINGDSHTLTLDKPDLQQ